MHGTCLCRDLSFTVDTPPGEVSCCHCSQCRKQSGHYWASAEVPVAALKVEGEVTWFEASDLARRGFCGRCGSFLFWQANGSDRINFAMGALDGPTGLRVGRHIFVADKGDYYMIPDEAPTQEGGE